MSNILSCAKHCFLADYVSLFNMYIEMGNFDCAEMQFKLQNSPLFSIFVSIPSVASTGFNSSAANDTVTAFKVWVLYEQYKVL
jgi:hypothetical protein